MQERYNVHRFEAQWNDDLGNRFQAYQEMASYKRRILFVKPDYLLVLDETSSVERIAIVE